MISFISSILTSDKFDTILTTMCSRIIVARLWLNDRYGRLFKRYSGSEKVPKRMGVSNLSIFVQAAEK